MYLKTTFIIMSWILSTTFSFAEDFTNDLNYKFYSKDTEFSITAPKDANMITVFNLPGFNEFQPNINITVQSFSGDIDSYLDLSRKELLSLGAKLLSEGKKDHSDIIIEYNLNTLDKKLHFYARAVKKNNSVYLITATALESQWPQVSTKLKASVDSFELRKSSDVTIHHSPITGHEKDQIQPKNINQEVVVGMPKKETSTQGDIGITNKIEIRVDGKELLLNNKKISFPEKRQKLIQLLGQPSRVLSKKNTIVVWDGLGLYAYEKPGSELVYMFTVALGDMKKVFDFWPQKKFNGRLLLDDVQVSDTSTIESINLVKHGKLFHSDKLLPFAGDITYDDIYIYVDEGDNGQFDGNGKIVDFGIGMRSN